MHRAADLHRLHADGTRIVDDQGRGVVLGGVNLGGWLVEEMWMMPFQTRPPEDSNLPEVKDHVSLWRVVEKRLGTGEMTKIRDSFRNAWIADADFRRIHDAGMNCVRVPFTYDLLEEPDGFAWLDGAIQRAASQGLYTILDLHGTPGRQSGEHHTGESNVDRLFKDPEAVSATEKLWAEIARRYRDRPEVAAYDLMNEPMGAPDPSSLYLVQDRIYRAIRAVDPKHLIVIEDGYKGIDTFPRPALAGWKDVVYSTHHYNFQAKSLQDQDSAADSYVERVKKFQETRPVPFLVGEYQFEPHGTPETHAKFAKAMERKGLSWTVWTYKTAMKDGGGGMWGWYAAASRFDPIDPFRDSAEAMIRKIEQVKTERLSENRQMTRGFKARLD